MQLPWGAESQSQRLHHITNMRAHYPSSQGALLVSIAVPDPRKVSSSTTSRLPGWDHKHIPMSNATGLYDNVPSSGGRSLNVTHVNQTHVLFLLSNWTIS